MAPVSDESEWITLTTTSDVVSARMALGLLESAGIECAIRDVNVLAQAAFLSGERQGFRIEVRAADREDALAMLKAPPEELPTGESAADAGASESAGETEHETGENASYEPGSRRALRLAVWGFLLWPLLHPISLFLALRCLRRKDLSNLARRDAWVAVAASLFSLVLFALVLSAFFQTPAKR